MSAQATALHRREKSASALVEICSVRLGPGLFGVPIRHIVEIIGSARPHPVPLAPGFVGGLLHYRGDVLTTVSLRRLLGLPRVDQPMDTLILESPAGCFGLLVDSVVEVLTLPAADHEPNPSTLDDNRKDLFAGAYKLKGSLLVMLDPQRLDPIRLGAARAA
ncbi:MAG: purine-binding chemotaxis protein CheW [Acidobacteriota bacterium]|nr:purine-binding chemotaxis protein CheW [Acidobacteriota bacterium]